MPKVKKYVKPFQYVSATIGYWLSYNKMSKEELFDKAGFTHSTGYDRLKNPEKFQVGELDRISRVLGISFNDLITGNSVGQQNK